MTTAFDFYNQTPTATPARRRINDLPASDRPLYRLNHIGSRAMSTNELLALLLGTPDAPGLADDLLRHFGNLHELARASKNKLTRIHGIGEAQAARLLAAIELGQRLQAPAPDEKMRITTPVDAANLLMTTMRFLEQEEFCVVLLNTRNQVMAVKTLYTGSLNSSVIRVAEVFRHAIEAPAAAIIIAHNHPSGDPSPSPEDIRVTRQIVQVGKQLDIEVLDHVIVGDGRYVSLKERGLGFD
ncbi:MAG: DNA repair protein RadC [Anaerolineae bacterium]|nr:DNA repair protein RadC [Anaerolineae bacterium]